MFPLVIAPGTSLAIPIRLAPTTPGPKTTTLTFTSNDPVTPAKNVTLTGTAPVAELCHAPSFTALGMSLGPTFGSSKTGDFTFTGQGRHMVPFGERHNYAFQGQGEYLYYQGRHEGEIDLGLMNRWHHVQLGVFSNFKFADFGVAADGGAVGTGLGRRRPAVQRCSRQSVRHEGLQGHRGPLRHHVVHLCRRARSRHNCRGHDD